jgi:HlyD family secretion protein
VLAVPARQGMTVTGADAGREGNMLLELADLTRLRVEATINEIDVGELALGLPVGITFDSAPGVEGTGKVTFISPAAVVTGQGAGGGYGGALENRVREFPIQVEVENSHPRIRPGVTARVHILTGRAENALALPLPAVFGDHETGEWFVFVRPVDDAEGEPVRTRVEVGLRDDHFVEIRSGLDAAAEVSLRRPPGVRLGQDK